jgi:hypothetical protein
LTWASCECGCGFEGEDDVTQFCIEYALDARLDRIERQAMSEANDYGLDDPSAGDSHVAAALAQARAFAEGRTP